jgi:hypothetical protein
MCPVFSGGREILSTIAGMAAVDFQIVGADRNRHAGDSGTATGQICYISLLHVILSPVTYWF